MCLAIVTAGRVRAQATGPGVVVDEREEETPRVLCLEMGRMEGVLHWLSYQRTQVMLVGTTQGLDVFQVYRYGQQYDVAGVPTR